MIKKVIKNMSELFGTKIGDYYSFPSALQLQNISEIELMQCKTGFRAKYILDAVCKVCNGDITISSFFEKETLQIKKELMSINGIGPKVSDCIMLFSCFRGEVFPLDIWVKRVMQELYLNGEEVSLPEIQKFAKEKFGEYAGFAQQYLFHFARMNKIGVK